MIQRYAVFNPLSGTHIYVDTMEEAIATKATFAEALYDAHACGNGINPVNVAEDGSILWSQPQAAAPGNVSVQIVDPSSPGVLIPINNIPVVLVDPSIEHS